jgi:hypothetical protein
MRGHVRKPGSVWCFVIDLPRGGTGARRRRWCSGFTTKKQAQTAASALSDLGRGVYVEPSAMTVSDFLQRWQELCGKDRRTIYGERQCCPYSRQPVSSGWRKSRGCESTPGSFQRGIHSRQLWSPDAGNGRSGRTSPGFSKYGSYPSHSRGRRRGRALSRFRNVCAIRRQGPGKGSFRRNALTGGQPLELDRRPNPGPSKGIRR